MKQILSSLILFQSLFTFSQTTTITGTVRDADTKDGIGSAVIRAEGKRASVTNASGQFKVNVEPGQVVIGVSYLGYKNKKDTITINAGETKNITIELRSQSIQLNEVVTSSFYKKNAAKESVSMEVITKNQIKNTNANDLGDIVSKTPGVLVQDGQISIRGGSSFSYGVGSRTAVLVDNLGMTSADLGEGQNKMVPVENTKQVEVIKGASSVIYGSSALNGIVNVITEWPKDNEPRTDIDINTTFFDAPKEPKQRWWVGGTPFGINANINHQQKIKDLQLVAGGNITGAFGFLETSNEFRFRYFLKTRHLNPKIEGLNYGVNFSQMYERSDRFFIGADMDTNALNFKEGSNDKYLRTSIDPHVTYQSANGHRASLNLRYINIWRKGNGDDINANSNSIEFQPQYQYTYRNLLVLTAGVPVTTGFSLSNLYPGVRTNFNAAVYAQAEINYKFLSWTGGVRYEAVGVDTFVETSKPIFRTGINLRAGKASFFRASWGQGYRIPAIGERFVAAEFSQGIYVIPNDTLKTETGWNLELGFKQGFQIKEWKAYIDAAFFWQEYKNFVQYEFGIFANKYRNGDSIFPGVPSTFTTSDGQPGIFGLRAANVENARVAGYEFSIAAQGKIGKVGLQILAGYTYTYPVSLSDTTSEGKRDVRNIGNYLRNFFELNGRNADSLESIQMLMFRTRHLFRADVEISYWKAYLGVTMFYGSFPDQIPPLFTAAAAVLFNGGEKSLTDYIDKHKGGDFVVDLRAGISITEKFRMGFIVKNVSNYFYALRPGKPEPHRNFTVQLRYTL